MAINTGSQKSTSLSYLIPILVLALGLLSCKKKAAKAEEPISEAETNDIYGYFARCYDSYQDNRGNPTSSGGGAGIRAYFTNFENWKTSTRVTAVNLGGNELTYGNEDYFSNLGFSLSPDSLSRPQQYYYLPVSAYTSTFVFPTSSSKWSVSGLNSIPDFTYVDSLSSPLILIDLPKATVSKSSGFTIAFSPAKETKVRFELMDEDSPSAKKFVTSLSLVPRLKNGALDWDSIRITPSNMAGMVPEKTGAFCAVYYETSVTKRISGKLFKFSEQNNRRYYLDIKK